MDTINRFASHLLRWIKEALAFLGVSSDILNKMDEGIYLVLIILLAIAVGKATHFITLFFTRRVLKYKEVKVLRSLVRYSALRKISWIVPPLIVSVLLPFAFEHKPDFLRVAEKITWIYFVVVLVLSTNVVLSSVGKVVLDKQQLQNRPMKGFIQILQVLMACLGTIIVISILLSRSPLNLITGLGAFAAVLMLVFKDTILGFVAGVLLAQNDMVHIGDWIEIPNSSVNGVVQDIALNVVKVQNFDNTLVTVPPYLLISGSLINWRAMSESGGRRIMRSYTINTGTVQPCTDDYLERIKMQFPLVADYITEKQKQQTAGKVMNTDNMQGLPDGTIDTNLGLFRAYFVLYLRQHPFVNKDLTLMVRTLEPTPNGLPLQVYCFSANKNWTSYESIQAEIMEHFVCTLPLFGLYPFQNATSRDYINSGVLEGGGKISTLYGIPWHTEKETIA